MAIKFSSNIYTHQWQFSIIVFKGANIYTKSTKRRKHVMKSFLLNLIISNNVRIIQNINYLHCVDVRIKVSSTELTWDKSFNMMSTYAECAKLTSRIQ